MSDFEKITPALRRQYESAYGPLANGEYPIGSQIKAPGVSGEVIWVYRSARQGLTYVVSDGSFPVEVAANEVRQSK